MKQYDVVIVGTGSGANLVGEALAHEMSVALVDKGPVGGTCLNLGCIPTKMMVFPADRIMEIREAAKFGIEANIGEIDFARIMDRMRKHVGASHDRIRKGLDQAREFDFYFGEARFIDDYTLEVDGTTIRGEMIFLASGARPSVPPVKGIDTVPYLTNESVLQLEEKPASLVIIGGGYIAAEFAHFFEAMGSRVTIIQRNERLVPEEEPEISDILAKSLGSRMEVLLATEATSVRQSDNGVTVRAKNRQNGEEREISAEHVLVAAGRTSNADLLQVAKTGVETDASGYIRVDAFLETSKKNIWAFGDAIGKQMFRHAANFEADLAWDNAVHGANQPMDFSLVPHAVFSWPEIASVGLTEKQALEVLDDRNLLIGRARYTDVARGQAMLETEGLLKVLVDAESERILGFHIIGPQASILIQEVVNVMAMDADWWQLTRSMRIHPALTEVVLRPFAGLRPAES